MRVIEIITQGPQGATGPQGSAGPTGSVDTTSFVTTASFNQFTSSIQNEVTTLVNATSSYILSTQTSSFVTNNQTSSFVQSSQTSSLAGLSSTTTGVAVTGTTNNTFSKALYVSASIFKSEDAPVLYGRTIRTGVGNASYVTRVYWNTTPDISGSPILIGTITAVAASNFFGQFSRLLSIVDSTNDTVIWSATTSTITDLGATVSSTSAAINWTQGGHIVVAIQLNNSSDSVSCRLIKIN
jgi:hypothetical protein